jgi:hypothetical protein
LRGEYTAIWRPERGAAMADSAETKNEKQGPALSLAALLTIALVFSACGARAPRVPEVSGALADVIVESSFTGEPAPAQPGALMLDSAAFGQLARLAGASIAPSREHRFIDPTGVLECPPREPCRVRNDAIFLTVWDAVRLPDGQLDVVVSRTHNIRRLYVMTESVTHELRLRPENGTWRLVRRVRLPG